MKSANSQHHSSSARQPPHHFSSGASSQYAYIQEFNRLNQRTQQLIGKASTVAAMRSPRPQQQVHLAGNNAPSQQFSQRPQYNSAALQPPVVEPRRTVTRTPSVQNLNMPLQRPLADSRASQKLSQGTLQTDSAFKAKFAEHASAGDAPKPFRQPTGDSHTQERSVEELKQYYEKHAYLMDDPSTNKLITDSMLQGRVKANGHLETWAQSRSTNLLDSTDPSKMIMNSRDEAILKTSFQELRGPSAAAHHQQQPDLINVQNFDPQTSMYQVTGQKVGASHPDVSITDYLQPNDQSRISVEQNQRLLYAQNMGPSAQGDLSQPRSREQTALHSVHTVSEPKPINFHPSQQNQHLHAQAMAEQRVSRTVSKNSFKRDTSGAAMERAASNPDFVTVNASADLSRQHHTNTSKQNNIDAVHSREQLMNRQTSLEGLKHNRSQDNKSNSRASIKRSHSQLEKSKSQRSISEGKSQKSQKSHRSSLTENPMHYENSMVHKATGFTDAEGKQYRDFDQNGRNQQTFQQRAALAGIKNLQSTSYRQDGPINAVVDRFPEKFSTNNAANHNPGAAEHNSHSMSKNSAGNRSHNKLQRHNADNNHSSNSNAQVRRDGDHHQAQVAHLRNMTEHRQDKHQLDEGVGGDNEPSHQFSQYSRTMLSSQQVLDNVFPEDQPEKPVQFFSGQNSADELTPHQQSEDVQHHQSQSQYQQNQQLDDEFQQQHTLGNIVGQSSSDQLINYQNLMSMTQGVDQTIQLLANQGPLTQRTAAENQFVLEASFCAVSDTILTTMQFGLSQWLQLTYQDKLLQFTSMLQNVRKDLRLGGLIGIYQLMRGDTSELQDDILNVIIEEVFLAVADYEAQEQIFLACALEIIGFIGPHEKSFERIQVIRQLICEPVMANLQINCVACLVQLGYEGLRHLVELATKDYNRLQPLILTNLLQIRAIRRVILTPSILSQLNNAGSNSMSRVENLAMLNRLGQLVWEAGGLPILVSLIEEGNVDRQLVASVLRTSGKEGEAILLKLLKYHKNERVRMAAASVLSYRLPENPYKLDLEIELESSQSAMHASGRSGFTPGQVCRYLGPLTSLTLQDEDRNEQESYFAQSPVMEVNTRDFLASLHRMLSLNNDYFIHQFDFQDERKDVLKCLLTPGQDSRARGGLLQNFSIQNVQTSLAEDPTLTIENVLDLFNEEVYTLEQGGLQSRKQVSDSIVRTLSQQLLKEENTQVKEVVAAAIGGVGLPEAQPCLDALLKSLKKKGPQKIIRQTDEPAVRCMVVWAIGRLASTTTMRKAAKTLIDGLSDQFFKVRASACSSIAQFGIAEQTNETFEFQHLSGQVIPILVRLLRDGQLNKQTVAETIVLMGAYGEQTLVNILTKEPECNLKLRSCIVRALALANVNNASIDFVIEMLFKVASDKKAEIRKAAIMSLDILRKKAVHSTDQVTYLKAKSMLPFLYNCLLDRDRSVRNSALLAIANFGPQGELMFIEGVTKESNPNIRLECAKGLGKIGATTFRTLMLTLHDPHPAVKEAASNAILRNMTPQRVYACFEDKEHQRQSLLCSVQEVIMSDQVVSLASDIYNFLTMLAQKLEENMSTFTHGDDGANSQQHYQESGSATPSHLAGADQQQHFYPQPLQQPMHMMTHLSTDPQQQFSQRF